VEAVRWSWLRGTPTGLIFGLVAAVAAGVLITFATYSAPFFSDAAFLLRNPDDFFASLPEDVNNLTLAYGPLLDPTTYNAEFYLNTIPWMTPETTARFIEATSALRAGALSAGRLGAVLGAVIGLITGGIYGGLRGRAVSSRTRPNQGIRRSIRLGLIFWVAGAGVIFPSVITAGVYFLSRNSAAVLALQNRTCGWPLLLPLGLFVVLGALNFALERGLLAAMQHFWLRAVLTLRGVLPRNLAAFLDDTTENVLMRKVGGGYIFIHRMLLEHFAAMDADGEKAKRAPQAADTLTDEDIERYQRLLDTTGDASDTADEDDTATLDRSQQ